MGGRPELERGTFIANIGTIISCNRKKCPTRGIPAPAAGADKAYLCVIGRILISRTSRIKRSPQLINDKTTVA